VVWKFGVAVEEVDVTTEMDEEGSGLGDLGEVVGEDGEEAEAGEEKGTIRLLTCGPLVCPPQLCRCLWGIWNAPS